MLTERIPFRQILPNDVTLYGKACCGNSFRGALTAQAREK